MTNQQGSEKLIILGSGPAGLTAAIYAARANLNPIVVEGVQPGGQLTITSEVENFPGFDHGIQGPELMQVFRKQAERFGTRFIVGDVQRVTLQKKPFEIIFSNGSKATCDSLIVATGASAKWLGIPSEKRLMGKGVSACATCDGFFFKNQDVAVVGGGDSAVEEATFLTKFAKSVKLIHRRDELRASKIMQDRAKKNPKISFVWDSEVSEVLGKDAVEAVRIKNIKTGATQDIPVQGLFMAIGHVPNSSYLEGQLKMDQKGYVWVEPGTTKTSVSGVFAAGDLADSVYRQAVTAAGTGCMAALDAERYLESLHG